MDSGESYDLRQFGDDLREVIPCEVEAFYRLGLVFACGVERIVESYDTMVTLRQLFFWLATGSVSSRCASVARSRGRVAEKPSQLP